MDPFWQAVCFLISVVLLLLAAWRANSKPERLRSVTALQLACVGWAVFVFVFLWNAAEVGW